MGPIDCAERPVNNYQHTLRNNPEERRLRLHRGGSLKSLLKDDVTLKEEIKQIRCQYEVPGCGYHLPPFHKKKCFFHWEIVEYFPQQYHISRDVCLIRSVAAKYYIYFFVYLSIYK